MINIAVIIPILNPNIIEFKEVIRRFSHQTIKPDIYIINSGQDIALDDDVKIIKINQADFNHSNTRNIALTIDANYYLFATQDSMPCDEFVIDILCRNLDVKDVVVAYARHIPRADASHLEIAARSYNYQEESSIKDKSHIGQLGIKTFFSSNSCAMYNGVYFREQNGFKKDLKANEDMEYAARAIMLDKKIAYAANAMVFHSHNFNLLQLWNRFYILGDFFKNNKWILELIASHKSIDTTGLSQVLFELNYLLKTSKKSTPKFILVNLIKYLAFKVGFYGK